MLRMIFSAIFFSNFNLHSTGKWVSFTWKGTEMLQCVILMAQEEVHNDIVCMARMTCNDVFEKINHTFMTNASVRKCNSKMCRWIFLDVWKVGT